ncbi:hypothetical protein [Gorillibacterium sp. sgz5001074]|uniref:hypothetical protein n=1 Tax=Gorillibacterium sp. sgz5001074 TaxID=3446695 RepID=UPI003F66CB1A
MDIKIGSQEFEDAELENVNKATEELDKTGDTSRKCLRCNGKLIYIRNGNSYKVKCTTDNCLCLSFRGL